MKGPSSAITPEDIVGLGNQMHHISLYLCGSDENHIEQNAHGLGKVSCGKGCIRFKKLEKLNLEVALELVKRAAG